MKGKKVVQKVMILGGTGLIGKAIAECLREKYEIIIASGHNKVNHGYTCPVEEPENLLNILNKENPDTVISALRGDFDAQLKFHEVLAEWLADNKKQMVYISTLNVFDKDTTKPVDEKTLAEAGSEYGIFKLQCEKMLENYLRDKLAIVRPAFVWSRECRRMELLKNCSANSKELKSYPGLMFTITLAEQVGEYVKYILDNNMSGVFHVGSEDMVDYNKFELMVCDRLKIPYPKFVMEEVKQPAYQAFLPTIRDIPSNMKMTIADILERICPENSNNGYT